MCSTDGFSNTSISRPSKICDLRLRVRFWGSLVLIHTIYVDIKATFDHNKKVLFDHIPLSLSSVCTLTEPDTDAGTIPN